MAERFDPQRVVDTLRELAALTSTPSGAQRVCWTDTWVEARRYLRSHLEQLPVAIDVDEAGNLWARLEGERSDSVAIGSHIDSVPDGGWLDGAFGVMVALETLRALAGRGRPGASVTFVDWADEEGARFGRSLFGSSAVAGTLDVDSVRHLTDRDGRRLEDVLHGHGVELDRIHLARSRLVGVAAYVEAHIEQGPVLEEEGLPAAPVLGTFGIERHRVVFTGETAHAGSTPIDRRRDALLPAASTALAVRASARTHGGVGTVGAVRLEPGFVTAIGSRAELLIDQRHADAAALAAMRDDVRHASLEAAAAERCDVSWSTLWRIEPIAFDERLTGVVGESCRRRCGRVVALRSGALHDAAEMARHVPTAMVFAPSVRGISHSRLEDTREEDLRTASLVYGDTVEAVIALVAQGRL